MTIKIMTQEYARAIVALGQGKSVDANVCLALYARGWAMTSKGRWVPSANGRSAVRNWLVLQLKERVSLSLPRLRPDTVIITKANPSKPGTQAYVLYELMRKGKTMAGYVKLAEKAGIGASVARYYGTWFLGRDKISIK